MEWWLMGLCVHSRLATKHRTSNNRTKLYRQPGSWSEEERQDGALTSIWRSSWPGDVCDGWLIAIQSGQFTSMLSEKNWLSTAAGRHAARIKDQLVQRTVRCAISPIACPSMFALVSFHYNLLTDCYRTLFRHTTINDLQHYTRRLVDTPFIHHWLLALRERLVRQLDSSQKCMKLNSQRVHVLTLIGASALICC
jgi:hypothetical protein